MRLFLCEKPSQANDIAKVLGVIGGRYDGYFQKGDITVTWAFGHILTQAMPAAYGEEFADFGNIEALPVLPVQWQMEVQPKAAKQFKVIKGLLAKADEVVIATDADREGEVIAREILDYCGYRKKVSRFWTSGLDTASVKKALATIMPGQQKESLYQAGLARSRADWLVGMNLSRAYTVAYSEGFGKEHTLSIGRIQTPTLNLVVRRDHIIENFQPYPYYILSADFQTASKAVFTAAWQIPESLKNSDGLCTDKDFVTALAKQLTNADGTVVSAKTERKKTPAPLPYSLSALQKEAGKKLGISASKVLEIAQVLYEKHKITSYPRTPCRYLPKSQQSEVADVFAAITAIDGSLSDVLAKADPDRPSRVWNDTQVNKHSHHAIIPTKVSNFSLSQLDKKELEIYLMIRNRYIAQFYPDYEYDATVILAESCGQQFKATGQTPKVQGWKAWLGKTDEDDDEGGIVLPIVSDGDRLTVTGSKPETKKTAPPPRFTESTLLDEMQSLSDFLKTVKDEEIKKILRSTEGLGTEATRANIIDRLFEMNYIEKQKGKIVSTEKGRRLIARIPAMVADPVTTAKWELALAGIESGKLTMANFMAYQEGLIRQLVDQAKEAAAKKPASSIRRKTQ
ncbi:DNA topoisomerase 3 [Neisseria arctica]|uniref:DNA topoisomerase 3 n=1 Tax=Neisseria arctica TaxID=1470200 RepID=UPI00069C0C65|nr:DNA topoisomerase 3 [Neisseria arctica]UOO85673.1 DNA topoisomerase 3 [Neisseria arctica]